MKLSEKLIRIGLIILVGLSMYLSYVIWLSPSNRMVHGNQQENNQPVSNAQNYRKASDVFMPMTLTWLNGSSIQQTTSETLISDIQPKITAASFEALKTETYNDFETFKQTATITHGIEMNYVGPFSLQEFITMFDLDLHVKDTEEKYFTKIQLDFDQKKIRFINVKRYQISEAAMSIDQEAIDDLLSKTKTNWIQMSAENRLNNLQYNVEQPIKMKMYSYISSPQTYTVFRDAFFNDTSNIKINEDSKDMVLYDGSENMTIQESEQLVDFHGDFLLGEDSPDLYSRSFMFISRLGTNQGNIRFFDRSKNTANYRIFVEGYPVFSNDIRGQVNVTISDDSDSKGMPVHIQTSLTSIQVPIPSENEILLANNETVIDQLEMAGADRQLIRAMVIGYQWKDIENTNGVVDLIPTWYIRYDDTWYSHEQLLDKLSETGAE